LADDYRSGKLLTGEMKARCIKEVQEYVQGFQERRAKVTDDILDYFMAKRPLKWAGNPNIVAVPVTKVAVEGPQGDAPAGEMAMTKNQLKKLEKLKQTAAKKAEKAAAKASGAKAGDAKEGDAKEGDAETEPAKAEQSKAAFTKTPAAQ
jgi:tryptophanyl-tRNA synthetase